ncbi:hypothetical protein GCWU000282_00926 [Catonella morbi ATCC 51271]|uniref:Uncharacterized protein n=1 Tax=Catonella morbi ATCC 51271 TaxID=592026 RepID=V2ZA10_9FIRM|nr:hypothetical protein GCWU000282_00926 [Catonella morbi ATCC 51271]
MPAAAVICKLRACQTDRNQGGNTENSPLRYAGAFLLNKNLSEGCKSFGRETCLTAPIVCEVCTGTHYTICGGKQ